MSMSWKDHRLYAVVCLLVVLLGVAPQQASATEESLRLVPEDAAFYWSISNAREQIERVAKSNAVARIGELIAEGKEKAGVEDVDVEEQLENFGLENPLTPAKEWFEQEENKELLALLLDMVSNEVFSYGSGEYVSISAAYAEFVSNMYKGIARAAQENDGDLDDEEAVEMLKQLISSGDLEKFQLPDTVFGFKLTDKGRATTQMARLKELLDVLLMEHPEIAQLIKSEKIGDGQFLTLEADGSMIPWEELEIDELDDVQKELFEEVKPIIEKKSIAIAVGVRGDYLLLSIGDTNGHLKELGDGNSLFERPELARLRKHADKKLVSTAYISDRLAKNSYNMEKYFESVGDMFSGFILADTDLDDMVKKQIERELKAFIADLNDYIPEPGGYIGFSFMTERGYEGYTQSWMENLYLDGSRPLDITQHVGGDPICLVAGRGKYRPQDYQMMVKWMKKIAHYFHEYGMQELDKEEQANYTKFRDAALPVLERVNKAIAEMWIPAFRDGQGAFVMEAKLSGRQFHVMMPPAEQDLHVPEFAIVRSVSDPKLVKQATSEFVDVINSVVAKLHESDPDEIPEFKVPPPARRETEFGELFSYPYLEAMGADKRFAPTAGLSKDTLVMTLSEEHAERLLKKTPLKLQGIAGKYANENLATVSHFDWARFVDVLVPWVDYGINQRAASALEETDPALDVQVAGPDPMEIKAQVRDVARVLKCFRGFSSATMVEGDSLVTHYEWHFKDLND